MRELNLLRRPLETRAAAHGPARQHLIAADSRCPASATSMRVLAACQVTAGRSRPRRHLLAQAHANDAGTECTVITLGGPFSARTRPPCNAPLPRMGRRARSHVPDLPRPPRPPPLPATSILFALDGRRRTGRTSHQRRGAGWEHRVPAKAMPRPRRTIASRSMPLFDRMARKASVDALRQPRRRMASAHWLRSQAGG